VVVVFVLVLASAVVALMVLTALGARRRGSSVLQAAIAGIVFPVTWSVWYARDEHPYAAPD
jgi:predicted membrane metal-binding protein